MTQKELQQALKEFCQRGGMKIIDALIQELRGEIPRPKYESTTDKLVYDTGVNDGSNDMLDRLQDKILYYAQQ